MSEEQFNLLNRLVIDPLKSRGAEVFIFGSRVSGTNHPYSDVDLLYKLTNPLPLGFLSQIKEVVEESRFPFTVDLVEERDLAKSYRTAILQSMKPL